MDPSDERFVPATPMGRRYLEVHAQAEPPKVWKRGERTAYQRELAERDVADLASLASDFSDSVEQFAAYQPRDEPFYDERIPDKLKPYLNSDTPSTSRLAAHIERDGLEADEALPAVRYVDRELVPSRTTGASHFDEAPGTRLRLDLLLAADGEPIVAEVKAGTDENVYYALIQALALCAQLAPSAQRARLQKRYDSLSATGPMQAWILLFEHNSRGDDKSAMLTLSAEIAKGLLDDGRVAEHLSRIACVDAVIPDSGPVPLSEVWQHARS